MTEKRDFQRNIYLDMKSLEEARRIFLDRFPVRETETETVLTARALGRVTARPCFARLSSPSYHGAAMDGIAVKAEDTYGAGPDRPITLTLGEKAHYVNTGRPLPEGADAVIMIEQVQDLEGDKVVIEAAAYPWQHVRKVGEDIVATEMVLPHGAALGPYELGALVAAGLVEVEVKARPRVAIIPTGSELVAWAEAKKSPPLAGQLVEYNSVILSALTEQAGGTADVFDIVPDDYDAVLETLRSATTGKYDLVIMNAGSSAGSEDYTAAALSELGEVLVHGVTIMPGKPTVLGAVGGAPVIGNPGYPVSAVISFEQFARPLLAALNGLPEPGRETVEVIPAQALPSKLGLEEFLRVKIGRLGEKFAAAPLPRGAGSITTLTRADGVIRVPAHSEGVGAQEAVRAELLRSREDIDGALICIGSHDNTLDVLGDLLRRDHPRMSLSSSNVGSLGGLLTLRRGFSHLAGSHLLDTESGEYNIRYIKEHLAGVPVRVVNLVHREQGFLVLPGNPKNVQSFKDLARDDLSYINRQAGAGTRILLDYHLAKAGVSPDSINGYESEEYTHMAVAAAVLSGRADTGLAVYSSARALGLDFVPVTTERYDLVIAEAYWEDPKIQALLETIRSTRFKEAVTEMGGYGTERTGELIWTWKGEE